MASSILKGIRKYFSHNVVPGTLLAHRKHVIARGDSLKKIAGRYNVSLKALRRTNGLRNNRLRAGMVLAIPDDG